MAALARIVAEQ